MTERIPAACQIESAVQGVPGWSPLDQLNALYQLAFTSAQSGGDVLELGSWCGRSAVALGLAVKQTKQGVLHCVDLFPHRDDWYENADGSYSFQVEIDGDVINSYDEQTVWAEPYLRDIAPMYAEEPNLFRRFEATIRANNLEDTVRPYKGNLPRFFFAHPDVRLRLAFLDGHHSYAAVCEDIDNVIPHLIPGGWLCFDDAFTTYEGVDRAIVERVIKSDMFVEAQQITRKLFIARKRG